VGIKVLVLHARWQPRAVAAGAIVAIGALGATLPAMATWALMLAVLCALAAFEYVRRDPDALAAA
jgi:hypothetical protein